MTLGASRRQRQQSVLPVERLDRRLLIHAKDRRVRRRIQVQADHVGGLVSKSGALEIMCRSTRCGCTLCLRQMRCTVMKGSSNSAASLRTAPVRRAVARLVLERALEHPSFELCRIARGRSTRVAREQPAQPSPDKAAAPSRDESRVASQLLLDHRPRCPGARALRYARSSADGAVDRR